MSYNYVPPPIPAGYEGNEELFHKHKQEEADAAMKRHEESWKNPIPVVSTDSQDFPPSVYQPPVSPAPVKKNSILLRVLGVMEGVASAFTSDKKKKHTELYGTIRDEYGVKVAERDQYGTPRDRFGNIVDVDV